MCRAKLSYIMCVHVWWSITTDELKAMMTEWPTLYVVSPYTAAACKVIVILSAPNGYFLFDYGYFYGYT